MLTKFKIAADIAKIASEIYATIIDKSRDRASKDAKIAELEKQIAELKRK